MTTKRTLWAGLVIVALVGAISSFRQSLIVVQAADGRGWVSYLVAGLADPTLFCASVNVYDSLQRKQGWPGWSTLSLLVAGAVTGGVNIMSAHPHAVPVWTVRAWPPVAFVMALESLSSYVRRTTPAAPAAPVLVSAGQVAADSYQAAEHAFAASVAGGNPISQNKLIEKFGLTRTQAQKVRASLNGATADAT